VTVEKGEKQWEKVISLVATDLSIGREENKEVTTDGYSPELRPGWVEIAVRCELRVDVKNLRDRSCKDDRAKRIAIGGARIM
jgi:hypothetical protein